MNFRQRLANFIVSTAENAASDNLARDYWRGRNANPLLRGWSETRMTEADKYTGQMYGSVNIIGNGVVELAANNIKTKASDAIAAQAKAAGQEIRHPYLDIIEESPSFADTAFWFNYSAYMSLGGVYYILVVRNFTRNEDGSPKMVGAIQSMKLMNPYHVERIIDPTTNKVEGYREYNGGLLRDLAPEMVIDIRALNPIDWNKPWGMADAAKDSQFTLKTASDYTRQAIHGNINAPGIVSTDVQLQPEQLVNFKARFVGHQKGEPIFSDGKGKVTWTPMTTELNKAALDKIHDVAVEDMIAASGVGKTMLGIEQSGVTRDTAKVQRELLISQHSMPQLRVLLDALNQGYRNFYEKEWRKTKYKLYIDNPLGSDHDAELKDSEVRTSNFELYKSARSFGYSHEMAAKYAAGETTLEDMGEPTEKPEPAVETPAAPDGEAQTKPGKGGQGQAAEANNAAFDDEYEAELLALNRKYKRDRRGRFAGGGGGGGGGSTTKKKTKTRTDYGKLSDDDYKKKVLGSGSAFAKQPKFSDTEAKAIKSYAGFDYAGINGGLRRGKGKVRPADFVERRFPDTIKSIDGAIASHHLPTSTALYRGANLRKPLTVGQKFTDHGYGSTTFDGTKASQFVSDQRVSKGIHAYVFKINAPSGAKGVVVERAYPDASKGEKEFLLGRGTQYTVRKMTYDADKGHTVVEVDI